MNYGIGENVSQLLWYPLPASIYQRSLCNLASHRLDPLRAASICLVCLSLCHHSTVDTRACGHTSKHANRDIHEHYSRQAMALQKPFSSRALHFSAVAVAIWRAGGEAGRRAGVQTGRRAGGQADRQARERTGGQASGGGRVENARTGEAAMRAHSRAHDSALPVEGARPRRAGGVRKAWAASGLVGAPRLCSCLQTARKCVYALSPAKQCSFMYFPAHCTTSANQASPDLTAACVKLVHQCTFVSSDQFFWSVSLLRRRRSSAWPAPVLQSPRAAAAAAAADAVAAIAGVAADPLPASSRSRPRCWAPRTRERANRLTPPIRLARPSHASPSCPHQATASRSSVPFESVHRHTSTCPVAATRSQPQLGREMPNCDYAVRFEQHLFGPQMSLASAGLRAATTAATNGLHASSLAGCEDSEACKPGCRESDGLVYRPVPHRFAAQLAAGAPGPVGPSARRPVAAAAVPAAAG
ncbi:unnamed protein product, partial [Protopolystoma xenopodis]